MISSGQIAFFFTDIEGSTRLSEKDPLLRQTIEYQVAVGGTSVRAHIPLPAPMFTHEEQVFVKLPQEQLFEMTEQASAARAIPAENE